MNAGAPSSAVKTISLLTATCIVVANMVGTGIFTSLGFQVGDLPTGFSIMALWFVGGICALCGAFAYAELGATLPRSGGEYHFLGVIYHPVVGFLAGWVSATVGFAAPVAIAAMPFGTYLAEVWPASNALLLSLLVVWISTLVLLRDVRLGSAYQNGSTILKIALILVIVVAGFCVKASQPISFLPAKGDGGLIASAPFAISLYYVMYAYSGWNASTYIVGEMRNPAKSIPWSVGLGTVVVMALYLAVNAVFMRATPIPDMVGKQQVALVAGTHLFGEAGGKVMAVFICVGLVSTVSSMMWIGPRVTMAMGEDMPLLRFFSRKSKQDVPAAAILFQLLVSNLLLFTQSFEAVLDFIQFSLSFCSFFTVLGVIKLRYTHPGLSRPYRAWGYPVTPIIFLGAMLFMMYYLVINRPIESLAGFGMMLAGLAIYGTSLLRPLPKPQYNA